MARSSGLWNRRSSRPTVRPKTTLATTAAVAASEARFSSPAPRFCAMTTATPKVTKLKAMVMKLRNWLATPIAATASCDRRESR